MRITPSIIDAYNKAQNEGMTDLAVDERKRLAPLLRSGETLQWTGRPDPNVLFSKADLFLVPFSLLWGGGAITAFYQMIARGDSLLSILFSIPFVLLGLYLLIGRFIHKNRRKRNTVYALTEKRAIASTSNRSWRAAVIQGASININRSYNNEYATITFDATLYTMYQNTGLEILGVGHRQGVGFFDVPNPDELTTALDALR
jgi:hypothetical protein